MTNCPNCSAPLKPNQIKCDYCGTYFLDFESIDLQYHTPCFLRVRTDKGIVLVRVVPRTATFEFTQNYTDIISRDGYTVRSIPDWHPTGDLTMEFTCLEFKPVASDKEVLVAIEQENNYDW